MSGAGKLQLAWSSGSPKAEKGGGSGDGARGDSLSMLLRTLKAQGLAHEAQTAFFLWPSLFDASTRICDHLGDVLKESNGLTIAHDVVCRAVRGFAQNYQEEQSEEDAALEFIKIVADLAETLLQLKVRSWNSTRSHAVEWDICRESYDAFVQRASRKLGAEPKIGIEMDPALFKDEIWAARRAWTAIVLGVSDQRLLARAETPR